jgi:DNA-binding NarL/FixJ family response regulator
VGDRIRVFLYASDPVSQTGIAGQLRACAELFVVESDLDSADVAVVVFDEINEEALKTIRAVQRNECPRVVVVVTRLDESGLFSAAEAGACGFLRRAMTRSDTLLGAIKGALHGDGTVPPDLLGRVLTHVGTLQHSNMAPGGFSFGGFTSREIDVLRLLADGMDTISVAQTLSYSERTVKNVLQDVTRRHNLRNRTHAVAFALRQGLI